MKELEEELSSCDVCDKENPDDEVRCTADDMMVCEECEERAMRERGLGW